MSHLTDFVLSEKSEITFDEWSGLFRLTGSSKERFDQLHAWQKDDPNCVLPRVMLAEREVRVAWFHRGRGFASTVTDEGAEKFTLHMQNAAECLQGYKPDQTTPATYYSTAISVHTGLSSSYEKFRDTIDAMLEFRPRYIEGHRVAMQYLMPRWYGEPGENAFYASRVAEKIGGAEGEAMYVELAEMLLPYYSHDEYFAVTEIDYDRVTRHITAQNEIEGLTQEEKDLNLGRQLRFAWRRNDQPVVKEAVLQIIVNGWTTRNINAGLPYGDVMNIVRKYQALEGQGITSGDLKSILPPLPSRKERAKRAAENADE